MKALNTVIFICFVAYAVCQDEKETSTEITTEGGASSSSSVAGSRDGDTSMKPPETTTEGGASSSSSVAGSRDGDTSVKPPDQPETPPPEVSSSQGPSTNIADATSSSVSSPSETLSPEVSSSAELTTHDEDTTSVSDDLDTNNDTIITYSPTPGEITTGSFSTDETNTPTVYGDDTTWHTVIPVDDEDLSGTNNTVCSGNPCKNGGTCKEGTSSPPFSCECPTGYVGIRCETKYNCVSDQEGQECKNGFCAYSKDGLTRFCDCFVGNYWDNATAECREVTSVCDSNPCGNGGMCNLLPHGEYNCTCEIGFSGRACEVTDLCSSDVDCGHGVCVISTDKKTRSCKCDDGFYVEKMPHTCRKMISPCDLNPCKNGGECNAYDEKYNCTCEEGFSGKVCEITDRCVANEDCGHGACVLLEQKKTRSCKCDNGFYLEKQNHTCNKISNVCQPNPCLHDGICTVLSSSDYNCTCSEGYTGKNCDIRDMCVMDGGNVYCRNGTCENNFDLGIYYCTCSNETYFQYTERTCVELDMCPLLQCKNTQKCAHGQCVCKDDYRWNNGTLQDCEPNICSKQPCPIPDMICKEGTSITDYQCSCQEGYTFNGTHCNEVTCIFPHLNPCKQICSLAESGYECSCDEDFRLKEDNHTCELIGNNTCSNKTCEKGSCVLKSDMEICVCPPGYLEVEGKCIDICSAAKLSPGICPSDDCEVSSEGGFRCKCEGKFSFSEDKTTCIVRNMCQVNEIGAKTCRENNAQCVQNWNTTKGFECLCTNGLVESEDGICRDACSIESKQRECSQKGAICDLDKAGKATCKCPPYFRTNEKDGKCNKPAEVSYLVTLPLDRSTYMKGNRKQRSLDTPIDYEKISRDIKITIEEMFVGFTRANILYCNTTSGYILCKTELQFETEHETQLKRLETEDICLTNDDSKKCLLPPKLVLVKERISHDVIIVTTDPCDEDIKEELCGSETSCTSSPRDKSFNCSCRAGFMMRKKTYLFGDDSSFVESCKDIDECIEYDPCPSNSNCLNTIGSYICTCKIGFRNVEDSPGSRNQKCVEICNPSPCTHGVCSRRGDHDFDCKCDAGYRGAFCDLQDENFKRARVNTIIVGVVLGGILLITFILFAVCVSRLRKKKCLDNSGQMFYKSTEMKERGRINNAFQRE